MASEAQTPPGDVVPFGKYLLDAEIARGGMARVYRARLRGLAGFEKRLVVKQILPHLATDPRFVELFVREANVLVAMSHPGIVPVYELGVVDGVYFLAMEHVEGATLAEIVAAGALPAALAAQIGAEVADALHYAHAQFGLVHRDVTPRNVIVDTTGHARLLDFGIAAKTEGTATTEIFGSHGYMSPEQLRGETLSPASDVFALGVTLFEALTGRPAFHRADAAASRAALEGPIPELPSTVPAELARIVGSSLAHDSTARPSSASEVGKRLRGWLATERPEGVREELAARVASTMQAHEAGREGPATSSLAAPSGKKGEPSGVIRTLAQSKVLEELVAGGGTMRVERKRGAPLRVDAPSTRPAADGASTAAAGRTWLLPVIVGAVVILGVGGYALGGGSFGLGAGVDDGSTAARDGGAVLRGDAAAVASAIDAGVSAGRDRRDGATGAAAEGGVGASAASDAGARAAPDAQGDTRAPSYLTVNALPWAEASLDGRTLGTTPRRHLTITPGAHTLEVVCPPLGRRARIPLHVVSGSTTSVVVDLTRDPPDIRIE